MKSKAVKWLIAILLLLGLAPCLQAAKRTSFVLALNSPNVVRKPVSELYFGMHIHRADSSTPWPQVKFGSWRLWDANVGWPDLEPERGRWNFGRLDRYVAMARFNGTDILLPLGRTPRWASSRPDEKSGYGPGQAAEPADIQDWRDYVRTVGLRYKGHVREYEIWNEPNDNGFFSGTPEQLLALQREAYRILKEIDPENIVVMPAAVHAYQWLDNYLSLGGADYADVIGYHFYVPKDAPEAIVHEIEGVRSLMSEHGVANKPLWNTETGWWIANTDGTPDTGGVSPTWKRLAPGQGAAYVARALILGNWAGLDRFYWYAWDNEGLGLIEPRTKELKPAARAFGTVQNWLVGKTIESCSSTDSVWTCSVTGPGGRGLGSPGKPMATACGIRPTAGRPIPFKIWMGRWKSRPIPIA